MTIFKLVSDLWLNTLAIILAILGYLLIKLNERKKNEKFPLMSGFSMFCIIVAVSAFVINYFKLRR